MADPYAVRLHSEQDLERARTKGQIVGWVQGAVVTFVGMLVLNFIGWVPLLLVLAVAGFGAYKYATRTKGNGAPAT